MTLQVHKPNRYQNGYKRFSETISRKVRVALTRFDTLYFILTEIAS
jgi:hypothetical protein